jgi:hypothetical protein
MLKSQVPGAFKDGGDMDAAPSKPKDPLAGRSTFNGWTIIDTRYRPASGDFVLLAKIDRRGAGNTEYVTARYNAHSVAGGEWYWGHYSKDGDAARKDFRER